MSTDLTRQLQGVLGAQARRVSSAFGGLEGAQRFASQVDQYRKAGSKASKDSRRALASARRGEAARAVVVDDGAVEAVALWASQVAPTFVQGIIEHMVPHADRVWAAWPRDSGRSADGLVLTVRPRGTEEIVATFEGLAPYTFFVRYERARKNEDSAGVVRKKELSPFEVRVYGAIRQARDRYGVADYARIARDFRLDGNPSSVLQDIEARALGGARVVYRRKIYLDPQGRDAAGKAAWATQAQGPWPRVVDQVFDATQAGLAKVGG